MTEKVKKGILVRVEAPHFVAAIVLVDGVCTEAPYILSYAIGWKQIFASEYFIVKKWRARVVDKWDIWPGGSEISPFA